MRFDIFVCLSFISNPGFLATFSEHERSLQSYIEYETVVAFIGAVFTVGLF